MYTNLKGSELIPIRLFFSYSSLKKFRYALFSLQRKCGDYVVIGSNNLNAISGLHRHHEQIRFYAQRSWPADSNFRMNIRLKNLALLETDETTPTLTLAAKAQRLLFLNLIWALEWRFHRINPVPVYA